MSPYLEVEDLRVAFSTEDGVVQAVDGVSLSVEKGRTLAIVGESGSGKSVTSAAIMGLHNRKQAKITGTIRLDGEELVTADDRRLRELRGKRMAMIFQDPLSSLHPFYKVGDQIAEAVRAHRDVSKAKASACTVTSASRTRVLGSSTCCARSASPTRSGASTSSRTSCPAACGSGS